ncbi:hypothetical protein FDUTEX481_07039 [Tolypothrix sp. PCC 7601]|nr:hypothetical protein FDUTEX481_07039 [Tolypothrix sp. PCC 7601]
MHYFSLATLLRELKDTMNSNTCWLKTKGQEKTFNPYPLTFSPNQIPS